MFFLLVHVTLMMCETNLMHPLMKRLKQNRQWTIIMTFRSIQSATSTRFIFIIPSMQFTVKASLQIDFPWRVGNKICRATTTKIHRCAFEHKLNDLTEAWKDEAQKRMREKKLSSTYFPTIHPTYVTNMTLELTAVFSVPRITRGGNESWIRFLTSDTRETLLCWCIALRSHNSLRFVLFTSPFTPTKAITLFKLLIAWAAM